eukprot:6892203-Karenia_brevis.AAC.1
MEHARKIMLRSQQELMRERQVAPPVGTTLEIPPWAIRWNRLIIMHQTATRHALTGTILTHLEELRNKKEKDAYKEY